MRLRGPVLALAVALALSGTGQASDLLGGSERVKRYGSFKRCLAALQVRHDEASRAAGNSTHAVEGGQQSVSTIVRPIRQTSPREASFTANTVSYFTPTNPRAAGGGRVGFGTDWWCEGGTLWKRDGHSAWVPDPPQPPEPPMPPPARPAT